MRNTNLWIALAGVGGFCGVLLGALSAHGIQDMHAAQLLDKASHYLLLHSAAVIGLAALGRARMTTCLMVAAWLFIAGMTVFAGALTLLATTDAPLAAAATPFGGTAMMAGWVALVIYGATGWWRRSEAD